MVQYTVFCSLKPPSHSHRGRENVMGATYCFRREGEVVIVMPYMEHQPIGVRRTTYCLLGQLLSLWKGVDFSLPLSGVSEMGRFSVSIIIIKHHSFDIELHCVLWSLFLNAMIYCFVPFLTNVFKYH